MRLICHHFSVACFTVSICRLLSYRILVSNAFQIVKGLSLNCDFLYQNGGDEFAIHFEPVYNLSAGLAWTVLDGRLVISLMADNIL